MDLHETIRRTFEKVIRFPFKIEVESIDGWHLVDSLNITSPVDVIKIISETGRVLKCAKDHILYDENGNEVLAKDTLGKRLITESGIETIVSVTKTDEKERLYDLSLVV